VSTSKQVTHQTLVDAAARGIYDGSVRQGIVVSQRRLRLVIDNGDGTETEIPINTSCTVLIESGQPRMAPGIYEFEVANG